MLAYPGGIATPTPDPNDPPAPGSVTPATGGPLPVAVGAAADDAAATMGDAWRAAGWGTRLRTLPSAASEALELLLDRIVKAAVEDPYPVHHAEQVTARLETDGHPPPFGGAIFLALAARSRRTLKVGRRAVPLALAAKMGADVVGSVRLGAYELELLASLVVQRMRAAKVPVDPRLVQRITVNAYLSPRRRHDLDRPRPSATGQLAAMWVGRIMAVEPALGRVRKAADLIDDVDFVVDVEGRSDAR